MVSPSSKTKITFVKSFPEFMKERVTRLVIIKIKELNLKLLEDISYNYSCEGGIELPKTFEWIEYFENHPNKFISNLSKYQGSRQLRFITEGANIVGAVCKDSLTLFTDEELENITLIFNNVINNL